MRHALVGLLLTASIASADMVSQYQNFERKSALEHIIAEHTVERSPTGTLPVAFSTFKYIGLNHKLVGALAQDIAHSKFAISEPTPKSYVVKDDKKTITISTIEETIETEQASARYYIHMREDKVTIALEFSAHQDGSNTAYTAHAYIRPDTWGQRAWMTVLSIFPSFEKTVDEKILQLTRIGRDLFQELRENPARIEETRITEEEKKYLKTLFE